MVLKEVDTAIVMALCECGCGKLAKPGNRFILGHNTRVCNPMNNPDTIKKSAASRRGSKRTDAVRKRKSEAMIEYHREHSEMGQNQSEMMKDNPPMADPDTVKKQSRSMKNSTLARNESERQRGGNDVVDHHYIYDHSDLTKYTMKVTRSKHAKIHAWMRKSGIKVPHINARSSI